MTMPLRRYARCCCLVLPLVLAACATTDKTVVPDPAVKTAVPDKSMRTNSAARQTAIKPTPFSDEADKRTVYFEPGGTSVDYAAIEVLRENAQKLKEDPQLVVTLVGHTDNLGSAAYNLAVADRRIEAVSDRLRSLGVARNQIRRLPLGSEDSNKLKCESEACRRLMRKVELVYERR